MKNFKAIWVAVIAAATMIGSTGAAQANADDVRDAIFDGIRDVIRDRVGANNGRQRLVLRLGDAHYRGQNTIRLKQELRNQYPHLRLRGADLVRVRVVGKSRRGGGTAALHVGGIEVDRAGLAGRPVDFHNDQGHTFSRVDLMNNYDSRGAWQLKLRGNNKIRRVVVIVRTRNGGGGGPIRSSITCSSFGRQYTTCNAGFQIRSIQVQQQHSNCACVQGRTFGISGSQIWVDRGCRATFLVTGRRR